LASSSKQHHRLLSPPQFRLVYARGRKYDGPLFTAFLLKTESEDQRLGITVTRKFGRAVARNRCKRRLREAFRLRDREGLCGVGYDLVINAKSSLAAADFAQIRQALAEVLTRFQKQLERGQAQPRRTSDEVAEK
jgi:ribonuclease P protein component